MDERPRWERSITALLLCVFCSSCASLIGVTALGKQIYDLTHRELDLGLLGLAEFAPSAVLVLVTGSIADRFDRARVSSIAAAAEAASGAALAWYALTEPTSVLPIFALVLVFGMGRAFLAPANRALPADIVPASQLPWLTARRAIAWQAAVIVGPVIAGFLYVVHPSVPYMAMTGFLVVASVSMFFVRTTQHPTTAPAVEPLDELATAADPTIAAPPAPIIAAPPARGRLREALEGLRFIRGSPILLGAISLDLFAVLFGGAVALLPAIATDRLHVGAVGLGWLRAAGGIGAAIVTLWIVRRPITRRVGTILLASVAVFGVFTILLGATTIYAVAFVSMAVLNGADSVSVFIRSTLVPLVTPFDKRGRVLAVESVFIGASNELGAFESGVAGQLLGAPGAVVLGGAATLAVAGTYWTAFPILRHLDRFPSLGGRPPAPPPGGRGGAARMSFVPDDFAVPLELRTPAFVLRPLRVEHNERDHEAWMSSIEHIRATPGFQDRSWPQVMSLDENAEDLRRHEDDFATLKGFTYTVLDPSGSDVIGCVYIYPGAEDGTASVRSWVRATHASLDRELYERVRAWLGRDWPFRSVEYAPRER